MSTSKHPQRFRRYFVLAVASLVVNIVFPTQVRAQKVLPSENIGTSNAVINQPTQLVGSNLPFTKLPEPTDKPEPIISKTMQVRASAYSSTVDQCDDDPFTTASGTQVRDGIIAMNGIDFGTKIRIPSYYGDKIFIVTDRMNTKSGNNRIDIWMPNREDALDWGVRTVSIEILS